MVWDTPADGVGSRRALYGDPIVTDQAAPDPAPRPGRRTFTAEYKARLLAEYETAPHGEKGAVLRREDLFHSPVREWAARDSATLKALSRPGPANNHPGRSKEHIENGKLRAENARLTRQLEQTKTALDIMGKAHVLLENAFESTAGETWSNR